MRYVSIRNADRTVAGWRMLFRIETRSRHTEVQQSCFDSKRSALNDEQLSYLFSKRRSRSGNCRNLLCVATTVASCSIHGAVSIRNSAAPGRFTEAVRPKAFRIRPDVSIRNARCTRLGLARRALLLLQKFVQNRFESKRAPLQPSAERSFRIETPFSGKHKPFADLIPRATSGLS